LSQREVPLALPTIGFRRIVSFWKDLATLAGVTVLVALVSEIFVESVQEAAVAFGMTPAFVGFKRRLPECLEWREVADLRPDR
jgi:hypothetical protein